MAFMEFLKFPTRSTFPAVGDKNRLYIDLRSKKIYYWEQGAYQIASPDIVEQGSNPISEAFGISWAALKALRDAGELIPGAHYRITDYECTTVQANTQSAGHQFDIIVTADSVNKLNENARACLHASDTYFANSKLEAWQLKYCLDNDTSRFNWADEVNGKGVIYQMVDEFNNDCPYDFKNIMFKHTNNLYYYTFSAYDDADTGDIVDVSTIQNRFQNDDGGYSAVSGNIIKPWLAGSFPNYISISLNNIKFINKTTVNSVFRGIKGNTFGNGCHDNTFSNNCFSNTFGDDCFSNTFGKDCYYNTFGDSCSSNTFGNICNSNTFGDSCSSNTFGNGCYSNTFSNSCTNNTLGDGCHSNTVGNYCTYNAFGSSCRANTFDNYCGYNTFGSACFGNTLGIHCQYLKITSSSATQKRYIYVENGVQGASGANQFELYDDAIFDKSYQITYKKDADGRYVMTWLDDYDKLDGKYKNNNLDAVWKNLPHDIEGGILDGIDGGIW